MDSVEQKIVEGAFALFHRHGIKAITMDDIAKNLGKSKKTIYKYFANKKEVVKRVSESHMKTIDEMMEQIEKSADNPIDELLKMSDFLSLMFQNINPNLFFELKKYYPESWGAFECHKSECIINSVKRNLAKGIEQGLYRKSIEIDVLANFRVEQIELGFNQDVFPFPKFKVDAVQFSLFDHFIHGILSLKGHKLYNTYKQLNDDE